MLKDATEELTLAPAPCLNGPQNKNDWQRERHDDPRTIDRYLLLFDAAAFRDLDAAARAWLESRDAVPLLRLAAEYDTAFVYDPIDFSYGQYQTLICSEYPLLYDLNASRGEARRIAP